MSIGTIKQLRVPDLIGLTAQDATLVLETAGFPKPNIMYAESYEPRLSVISQTPSARQIKDSNTVIKLTISQRNLVRFLPAIYQRESAVGENFLRDFLWIFQHMLDDISSTIDNIHEVFDPYETPKSFCRGWLLGSLSPSTTTGRSRRSVI